MSCGLLELLSLLDDPGQLALIQHVPWGHGLVRTQGVTHRCLMSMGRLVTALGGIPRGEQRAGGVPVPPSWARVALGRQIQLCGPPGVSVDHRGGHKLEPVISSLQIQNHNPFNSKTRPNMNGHGGKS